ncbi:MAG TPA: hypothetical protein PKU93_00590 [Candidatus Pacearchaeota archaeon]|nr:hypothetical protein [Candidatus Pacearchaeota archaeon]
MIFELLSKNKKTLLIIFILILVIGIFFVWIRNGYKTETLSCDEEKKICLDGSYVGKVLPDCNFETCPKIDLPEGYTLEAYSIEKVLETNCIKNIDCQTPGEYLILSRCPFTSMCLADKCTVVCPAYKDLEWEEAEKLINNCKVKKIFQGHNRLVTLFLEDGSQLSTIEPKIDMVINLAESLKTKCGKIVVGTE